MKYNNDDVIIIGAGASFPYGFPTGFELLQDMKSENLQKLSINLLSQIYQVFYDSDVARGVGTDNQLKSRLIKDIGINFLDSLKDSCILSIDQFLKNHDDNERLQKVLKMLIAHNILSCEKTAHDWRFSKKENIKHLGKIDWIQHLISKIDLYGNINEVLYYLKSTTFISFNYDRVLEYFLFKYLVNDKKYKQDDAYKIISELKIFHINGHIGDLETIPFGANEVNYLNIIENMHTVWEKSSTDENGIVKDLVKSSKRIFVLGTSYIPDNNRAIGLSKDTVNGKFFRGTGLGLSKASIDRVSNSLGLSLQNQETREEHRPIRNIDALDLINDAFTL